MVMGAAIIAALYFGRDMLLPVAVAGLLSFALEPLVTRLRRWGGGRKTSVVIVVFLALVLVAGIGTVVGTRLVQLADNLPTYQENIQQKVRSLLPAPNSNFLQKASKALQQIEQEIKADDKELAAPAKKERPPVTVRVEAADVSALETLRSLAGPLIGPASTVGLVMVFLFFLLLQREDIRDRFIRLVSKQQMHVTTDAIDDAAQRVSRYLLMQLCVNASYGLAIGIALYFVGVPNALLWGLLGATLRFIPYVGAFIAAIFPVTLAFAVDPGWTMVVSTLVLFLVVEVVINNVIEPWLYGSSTGLSPVAIVIAAIFWTALWGPAGLLISTPLTVCFFVLGHYVPQLHFLYVLLGNTPALSPEERLYQRMLAGDVDEGVELAQPYFASGDLAGFHDDIALAALKLAETDRQRDAISPERVLGVSKNIQSVIADLEDAAEPASAPPESDAPVQWEGAQVMCVGGRSPLDTAAAALLADRLNRIGIGARVAHFEELSTDAIRSAMPQTEVVALIYLSERGPLHARQLVRKLRKMTRARILVGLFNGQSNPTDFDGQGQSLQVDFIAGAPSDALVWINGLARNPLADVMTPAPVPAHELERLADLGRVQLLDTPQEAIFDKITEDVRTSLGVPIALLSLVDETRQFWKSQSGLPDEVAAARESPRDTSICGHVVGLGEMMVIEDVLRDTRFANNPILRQNGIRFYAGAPLMTGSSAIGTLCVMDTKPRQFGSAEIAILRIAADGATRKIAERAAALAESTGASNAVDAESTAFTS